MGVSAGEGRMDLNFSLKERPKWRRSELSSSEMIEEIVRFHSRYVTLTEAEKSQARAKYAETALAEFLFQVNKIENEGFNSYGETVEAISKGALQLVVRAEDSRLESLCSLYKALKHWWVEGDDAQPSLCIQELEICHRKLMASSKGDIAGKIRRFDKEVVYTNTEDGVHAFTWPTEVRPALEELFRKTKAGLTEIDCLSPGRNQIEALLKLGGCFFLEFENIHPFIDGNGRCGRILLAVLLRSIMPFPNVLFVDRPCGYGLPPYVTPVYYYDCFHKAQSKQHIQLSQDGQPIITKQVSICHLTSPRHLTALITEGVYVGWKRFFADSHIDI